MEYMIGLIRDGHYAVVQIINNKTINDTLDLEDSNFKESMLVRLRIVTMQLYS